MKRSIFILLTLAIGSITMLNSCDKPAGEGGTSTIKGKIYVKEYNSNFTILQSEHFGMEERVYIIYGDGDFYDDDLRTSYDGTYEFRNLRKGSYRVFTYTEDSTMNQVLYPGGVYAIIDTVQITDDNQTIELPTITIYK